MSTHPFIPLYVDDYEAATVHLSVEEDGVYNRLLRLCWRTPGCCLPDDTAWIARKIRISADDFERVAKPVLSEFFVLLRGRWIQRRLKREYDDISRKKTARKLAGKKGGDAKARKTKDNPPDNANDLPAHTRAFPEPEPEPEPEKKEGGGGVARGREPDPPKATDWPEGNGDILAKLLVEATGTPWLDLAKSPELNLTLGRFAAWKRDGASWAHDVLPVVTALCGKQRGPISSWKFFDKAIARSIADNRAALEIPEAGALGARTGGPPSITDRIAAENAEARRRAFAMLDAKNG